VCFWVATWQPNNGAQRWSFWVCFGPQEGSPVTAQVGVVVWFIVARGQPCSGATGRQQQGLPGATGQSGNGANWRQKLWFRACKRAALSWRKRASKPQFIGCKRAALGGRKRASNQWFTGCKRAIRYRCKWAPNTAI
jgi:hypothetical protein